MVLKIEREEDKQLPRWVYALMSAKADPDATGEIFSDSPKLRYEAKVQAENFYKQRQARLKEMTDQSSRLSGLEWKHRPRTTFNSQELDQIMPTRRLSYILRKTIIIMIVMGAITAATGATVAVGAAVCAEIKLRGSFQQAWSMFQASPSAYIQRVRNALKSDS